MREALAPLAQTCHWSLAKPQDSDQKPENKGGEDESNAMPEQRDAPVPRKSHLVESIQTFLLSHGLHPGPVDGVFGTATQHALEQYEESHGLTLDSKPTQELLDRLVSSASNDESARNETQASTTKAGYVILIRSKVMRNWVRPEDTDSDLSTKVTVQLDDSGDVLKTTIDRSSSNTRVDESILTAIEKTFSLPIPKNDALYRTITFTFRPDNG